MNDSSNDCVGTGLHECVGTGLVNQIQAAGDWNQSPVVSARYKRKKANKFELDECQKGFNMESLEKTMPARKQHNQHFGGFLDNSINSENYIIAEDNIETLKTPKNHEYE